MRVQNMRKCASDSVVVKKHSRRWKHRPS